MKLTFFITSLGGGGAERVLSDLSNYLSNQNHTIKILVLRGDSAKYELSKKVIVEYLQPDYYKKPTNMFSRVREVICARKALKNLGGTEALICFLELPVLLGLLLRKNYSQPLLICERNNPENYPQIYQKLYKKYAYRADGCVCQTEYIAKWYSQIIRKNSIKAVIPNAIGAALSEKPYSNRSENIIVTMGRLEPQKNHRLLIESFAQIAGKYKEYKLKIYGNGFLKEELIELSRQLNIEDRVMFPGYCSDLSEILGKAEIFAMSSDFEGMPNALAEAMAMGVPCVSTDCAGGGARQLIDNGMNGILVPRGDKEKLSAALEALIVDENYANKIAIAARNIRTTLLPNTIYNKWESLLYNLVNYGKECADSE